jgi:Concanavalin A-like lectin/glucanases superfamily
MPYRTPMRSCAKPAGPLVLLLVLVVACSSEDDEPPPTDEPMDLVWILDNTQSIGGHTPTVLGAPTVTDGALCFDGVDDALIFSTNPLEGLAAFTVEVRFLADSTGAVEQRFVHLQQTSSPNRALIETRVAPNGSWHLDTYLRSGTAELALIDPAKTHPTDIWQWAALSYANGTQRHFVDAVEELSGAVAFAPLGAGEMSIGTRINQVDWFKGCASELRIHDRALPTGELGRD